MSPLALKLAFRSLRRAPAFSGAAILTLGLGIGAVCAIFTVVNAVLIRPLPFADPDRLVGMWHSAPGFGAAQVGQSLGTYFFYRRENHSFENTGVYEETAVNLSDRRSDATPERVQGSRVTATLLTTLGVSPMLGRNFSEAEDRPGGPRVALISEALWRSRFSARRSIIGETIEVDGESHTVVGVMSGRFRFPRAETRLWLPLALDPAATETGGFDFNGGVGRLRPGVTLEAAESELQQILPRLAEAYPNLAPGIPTAGILAQGKVRARLHRMRDDVIGDFDRVLWIIAGTAALVLLVACVNVANLLLVRAEGRQKELAVRSALGAGRRRVLGHFLVEGSLLASLGGALGVGLAWAGVRLLVRLGPAELPRLGEVAVDWATLGFALAVSTGVALLCSAIPAFRYLHVPLGAVLREDGRGGTSGRSRQRTRGVLVAAQVALSLVLLAGSGLLVRSVWKLQAVPPGFDPERVLTLRVSLPESRYPHGADVARFHGELTARLEGIPGVTGAGVVGKLPLRSDGTNLNPVYVEDAMPAVGALPSMYQLVTANGGYFVAAGIPLLGGRVFDRDAGRQRPDEVVVSRTFADQYWKAGGADGAIGRRVRIGPTSAWATVVGVVESVRDTSLQAPAAATVYVPAVALPDTSFWGIPRAMNVVVKTRGAPSAAIPAVTREIHALDASLPVFDVQPMRDIVAGSMARISFTLLILAVAAGISLVLGAVGLYGVVAYVVSLRTREIGIRMALGARPGEVSRLVAREGLVLALWGTVTGLAAFAVLSRFLQSLLFGVSATDPVTLLAVSGVLLAVAALSSWAPAHRAANISPLEALRVD